MSAELRETEVVFPGGATSCSSEIVGVWNHPVRAEELVVVTTATAFHPEDNHWPDQPSDRGTLAIEGMDLPVPRADTAALDLSSGTLHVGSSIPVRTGTPGWVFLVGHIVSASDLNARLAVVGASVLTKVDVAYRVRLSRVHTACHLMALALNSSTADFWEKEPPRMDSLGHPELDGIAIASSAITAEAATDTYHLGKSLRKKGFNAPRLLASLTEIASQIEALISRWASTGADVTVLCPDRLLTSRRTWQCELPEGLARIPCGGTHCGSLTELPEVRIAITANSDGDGLAVRTSPAPQHSNG